MMTVEFNLDYLNPEFLENPYPTFAKLRAESPVVWDSKYTTGQSTGVGAWHIFKYEDIQFLLRDRRISSEPPPIELEKYPPEVREVIAELFGITKKVLVWSDPPKHTRLRSLVGKAFTSQVVQQMRPRIQEIVDELIDNWQNAQKIEFIEDFAVLLPIKVVSDLIGLPPEDYLQAKDWVATEMEFLAGAAVSLDTIYKSRVEYLDYIRKHIAHRRQHLGEDLLSRLIIVQEEGEHLSEEELEGMLYFLVMAAFETTVNALGNGMLALLQNPVQMELLRENPSLMETAVEEMLRYESMAQFIYRIAKDDVELQGNLIKAGQNINLCMGAGNRDPEAFPDPNRFDITRQNNRHLSFGSGIHGCLGAPLARLEMQIAFKTILQRLPKFHLAEEGYKRGSNPGIREVKSLHLV